MLSTSLIYIYKPPSAKSEPTFPHPSIYSGNFNYLISLGDTKQAMVIANDSPTEHQM